MIPIQTVPVRNPDYETLGGAERVRQLVDRFYDLMASLPETRGIRGQHPQDLNGSRQKLYEFLTGWLGGPQLYAEKHGQPRLRASHTPFSIGDAERDQWLLCMRRALDEVVDNQQLRERLYANLAKIAHHIRNT
ncbi:MAG: group II truncated hemoglobin [Gammaproteobacteria bacterium]|nr:group II truncated hemoglobin [Gammaproteobacteria bacterium]